MGGGLMQLVAYGAQDVYLTGDPQITYFKVVYRRHTNFSMECIEQTFNGTASASSKVSCTISRNGDLIAGMHIEYTQATAAMTTFAEVVSEIEVEIGGQKIDKHYGEWLDIWYGLTEATKRKAGLIGTVAGQNFVPLQFWFNRNVGLALPLIALQYHEVKINITFGAGANISDRKLWVDYIYLDTEERKRFAQMSHEYLIDQLQFPGTETLAGESSRVRLNFNHPVKEIVWKPNVVASGVGAQISNIKLMLNGHDRFAARDANYFTQLQKYYHHSAIPVPAEEFNAAALNALTVAGNEFDTTLTLRATNDSDDHVYVYSFALRPEEHQPSGTCNFSRIDNATLSLGTHHEDINSVNVYAVNYNVLRIVSGMGGLAYSN